MDIKEFKNLEKRFFEVNDEEKKVRIDLAFDKPDDIFDLNAITGTPMLNDDMIDWLTTTFEYVPKKYKLDLNVRFADMSGYTEEELAEIFKANVALEFKRTERKVQRENRIAYILVGVGLVLLLSMILIESLWANGGVVKTVFSYVFDIATTVTIWEAMTILLVKTLERRTALQSIAKRFDKITFKQK